ncbi:hypothetical protein [Mixta calida]|uniref:hypothetical protein n=1 Tax=Mixta calida TaxID=665913 RepID=UPI002FDD0713
MNKLTAKKCRDQIAMWERLEEAYCLPLSSELHLQAYRIALPVLEQQESQCQKCAGTGMADSGGTQPWGEPILIECDCQLEQQGQSDGWIEWKGGDCPVSSETEVQVRMRDGFIGVAPACTFRWKLASHDQFPAADIIAYRVVKHQEGE